MNELQEIPQLAEIKITYITAVNTIHTFWRIYAIIFENLLLKIWSGRFKKIDFLNSN